MPNFSIPRGRKATKISQRLFQFASILTSPTTPRLRPRSSVSDDYSFPIVAQSSSHLLPRNDISVFLLAAIEFLHGKAPSP
jgi:hypothetical protein